ncbi:MAG: hypothetical protein JJE55_15700 [Flavobacteriaceae bacterium]|nr:hypothetical protein [Flavobacteriaceae bacterium]
MTTFIIIIIIISLIFIFFKLKNKVDNDIVENTSPKSNTTENNIIKDKINWSKDEDGKEYRSVQKKKEVPRKTYIKAHLNGKYWGEIDEHYSNQFEKSNFFEFNIYEVILNDAIYKTDVPFQLKEDLRIPREKLPKLLNAILEKNGKTYEINLHEPIFSDIEINRKLHQTDGKQVFGTIDATVTGYLLDFVTEYYFEKEYKVLIPESIPPPPKEEPKLIRTLTPTGNVDYNANYRRTEYYYSDYKKTYWGDWKYKKTSQNFDTQSCFSTLIGIVSGIIGIAFILMLLPQFAFFIPLLLIVFLLYIIPPRVYLWLFRILGMLLLLFFIVSLVQLFTSHSNTLTPKPVVVNHPEETKPQIEPIVDSINNTTVRDTLITHFRVWQDYENNTYKGKIWTKKSDYLKTQYFKQKYSLDANTEKAYDYMIYSLKENDKNNLNGIYQLFDSIQNKKNLSRIKFAELIVTFIQDIPYTVILPDACNPNLYDDRFIREYLSAPNSKCAGFEKFGINSPVEFMSNLNGDCDTRTLLLYTMLSHYEYDIALLSSEYYSHSIIGINLPINGIAYQYQDQRYVLWETTAPNIRPGLLPKGISNLNYWRISLKSK